MRRPSFSSGIISNFLNFVYPSVCPSCSSPSDSFIHAPFCSRCWAMIKKYAGPSCRICGVPIVSEYADICGHCIKDTPLFSSAVSFGRHEDILATAIHQFKFSGNRRLAKPLAELMLFCDLTGIDAIVAVPMTQFGLRCRGFNQSLLLAAHISRRKKIPLAMDILIKNMDTPPQVGLSATNRAANVRNAFRCTGNVAGMNLLLVDDVMTTGSTVNACSGEMLRAGAKSIKVLTLARAGMI